MADMFWTHCNRCLTLYVEVAAKNGLFFVTNCAHVFCQDCANHVTQRSKCFVCNKTDVKTTAMDKNLLPEIRTAFSSILMQVKDLYTAADFQTTQLKHYIGNSYKRLKSMGDQARKMNKQLFELKKQLDQTQRRSLEAEAQNAKLKDVIAKYQAQKRRMSPAGSGLFRPVVSPVVSRKRTSPTDFFNQSQCSNGSRYGNRGTEVGILNPMTPAALKQTNAFVNIGRRVTDHDFRSSGSSLTYKVGRSNGRPF